MPRRLSVWCLWPLVFVSLFSGNLAIAESELGENQRIHSTNLGYDLQYRVYLPAGIPAGDRLASLYITDGQWYLEPGGMKEVIDDLIREGHIEPLVAVFVDSRNPDKPGENRRNSEFMCNRKYAAFFNEELVPAIGATYPVSPSREERVILGLSFGGLNSACFGIMLPELFSGIAMQSPGSSAHLDAVHELYRESPLLPLKVFLSVGTKNDNLAAAKRFRRTLDDKGYDLNFIRVREGHDWGNWKPLLDDVLLTFFAPGPADG